MSRTRRRLLIVAVLVAVGVIAGVKQWRADSRAGVGPAPVSVLTQAARAVAR